MDRKGSAWQSWCSAVKILRGVWREASEVGRERNEEKENKDYVRKTPVYEFLGGGGNGSKVRQKSICIPIRFTAVATLRHSYGVALGVGRIDRCRVHV